MSRINPKQVTLIKRLQEEFGFLNRPIANNAGMTLNADGTSGTGNDGAGSATAWTEEEGGGNGASSSVTGTDTGVNTAAPATPGNPTTPAPAAAATTTTATGNGLQPRPSPSPSSYRNARRASISVSASMTAADLAAAARDRFSIDTSASSSNAAGTGISGAISGIVSSTIGATSNSINKRPGMDVTDLLAMSNTINTNNTSNTSTITAASPSGKKGTTATASSTAATADPTPMSIHEEEDATIVEVPLEVLSISKEDETLLRRCKWLLGRLAMQPPLPPDEVTAATANPTNPATGGVNNADGTTNGEGEEDANYQGRDTPLSQLLAESGKILNANASANNNGTSSNNRRGGNSRAGRRKGNYTCRYLFYIYAIHMHSNIILYIHAYICLIDGDAGEEDGDEEVFTLTRTQLADRLSLRHVSCPSCFHLHYLGIDDCDLWADAILLGGSGSGGEEEGEGVYVNNGEAAAAGSSRAGTADTTRTGTGGSGRKDTAATAITDATSVHNNSHVTTATAAAAAATGRADARSAGGGRASRGGGVGANNALPEKLPLIPTGTVQHRIVLAIDLIIYKYTHIHYIIYICRPAVAAVCLSSAGRQVPAGRLPNDARRNRLPDRGCVYIYIYIYGYVERLIASIFIYIIPAIAITGCVDYFSSADRRHWARTLAEQSRPGQLDLLLIPQEEGWGALDEEEEEEEAGGGGGVGGATAATSSTVDKKATVAATGLMGTGNAFSATNATNATSTTAAAPVPIESLASTPWTLSEASGGSQGTFRDALRQLRTAYPAGLHAYGLRNEERGLYQRISEMRRQLQRITESVEIRSREANAYNKDKNNKGTSGASTSSGNGTSTTRGGNGEELEGTSSPTKINIYAQSLAKEVRAYCSI